MTHDSGHHDDATPDPRDQLLPYVLGELSDAERDALERQLAEDAELREELAEVERSSVDLMMALPQHAPPPALKARVFDAIDAASTHEAAQAPAPAPMAPPIVADVAAPADVTPAPPAAPRRARRGWQLPRWSWPAATGALAAACVALAVVLADTRGSLDTTQQQLQSTQRQLADASAAAGTTTTRVVDTNRQFSGARGRLVREGDQWLLVFDHVPDPGRGASWQVWTADKQGQISNVAQWSGDQSTRVLEIDHADQIDQVMVSHEHQTGPVPAPSGAPVAAVTT